MLPLSQSSGYAVLAMSCLEDPGGKPTLVVDVAARTGFPRPYLSKMIHKLAKVGLVMAKRGNKGGVVLSLAAKEIPGSHRRGRGWLRVAQPVPPGLQGLHG